MKKGHKIVGYILLLALIFHIKSVSLDCTIFSVRSDHRSTNDSPTSLPFDAKSCHSFNDGQTNSNLSPSPSPVLYLMRIAVSLGKDRQVFFNFRGEQLRCNFLSHLSDAFERDEIKFFIDKNEQRGKDLKNLLVRIEESRIALAIFSTRYPESSWCMDELEKMSKLAVKGKLRVIPIFYQVEAEDVRKPTGDTKFGRNFWRLAEASSGDQIKEWKEALEKRSESDCIKKEVKKVSEAIGLEEKQCWEKKVRRKVKECLVKTEKKGNLTTEEETMKRNHHKNPSSICFMNMIIGCSLLLALIFKIKSVSLEMASRFSFRFGRRSTNYSSPSPAVSLGKVRQVFFNFRGEELRYNFVSHLTDAFEKHEIKFFIDKNEQRGKDLKNLFVRIEESRIALAILSTRYTESRWCMDELVKMKKLAKREKLRVIPIFYHVKAKDVRKPTHDSKFGKNFWRLAQNFTGHQIDEWREALEWISGMTGVSFGEKRFESDVIKEIIEELKKVDEVIGLEEEERQCWGKKLREWWEFQLTNIKILITINNTHMLFNTMK